MVEVSGLTKTYGKINALRGVDFTAEHGQVLGLLGSNGAGKSTTMNIIAGYIPKTGGSVKICGVDIDESPYEAKKRLGYLPEHTPLAVNMTVAEFLEFSGDLKKVPKTERQRGLDRAVELTGLKEVRWRLIRNLSKGYRQRVGIAQALIGFPEVLILDEPTVGLDPSQLIEIRALVRELGQEHTVLFSSHILSEVESVCDRVVIIYKGNVLADGRPDEVAGTVAGGYRLTAAANQNEITAALRNGGLTDFTLSPITSTLEDAFVRLVAQAERETAI
ncbi:MAG: ABC transporter ATP-binding protein [Oscillospiraceae bacterium]|jgi:ABC-2 type transport system ATP-binding protein|nr:ABC transporter ATP-binding protein [Oscillospiraceae bacterium]